MTRAVSGALVALAHILFVLALLRFAETPDTRHAEAPVDYVAVVFIPAPPPVPAAASAPSQVTAAPPRRPGRVSAPAVEIAVPAAPATVMPETKEAAQVPQPPPARTFDMESLRAAARQAESERVPTALESLRESEQMRASDDSDLSRAVRQAIRPDCQTKYSQGLTKVNLILLVPLAIETIKDKGCKW
ncbi:hypothetical protein [Massilia oculi]|uniref:hypothetical protein n=1 Tax=Massilia oculi TaxID=945844 RepID=UPI0028AA49CC|nr:hypothetical protein [Massilia oculi]